jgi:hypothetical protein
MPNVTNGKAPVPRPEKLAVSLQDLDRAAPLFRRQMLAPNLDASEAVFAGPKRLPAVAFHCDLLIAACICDTLRAHDLSFGDNPTRVFIRRAWNRPWVEVPGAAKLTLAGGGEVRLNPALFPPEKELIEFAPPEAQAVMLGEE